MSKLKMSESNRDRIVYIAYAVFGLFVMASEPDNTNRFIIISIIMFYGLGMTFMWSIKLLQATLNVIDSRLESVGITAEQIRVGPLTHDDGSGSN